MIPVFADSPGQNLVMKIETATGGMLMGDAHNDALCEFGDMVGVTT